MAIKEFSTILTCVDGSKYSEKALKKSISIAEKFDSNIVMLIVIEEGSFDFWDDTDYKVGAKRPQVHLKSDSKIYKQAQKILEDLEKRIPSQIKCKKEILVGNVSNEILEYVKKNRVDLLVIGARGLGGFAKLLQGSTSSKVSEHASCSVLIVK